MLQLQRRCSTKMARPPISEEEILEVAEEVKERFLREYSESDNVDHRDLQHVRNDLEFVAKFTRQQGGDPDNAFNQMVESLKWRNRFGINDIHFEDVEEYLWRSGMACTHGLDKKGNHIVILNIRLHRKDSKKAVALQRWISFCFETHCRLYPKSRMCMIFDMTGCGLSQMDMELMRFIVNCFKIYFPDILAFLLVYNMPWILQAAWKIVQSWLSERAVAKVKFVNSETILEYISSDQLLVNFGGTDEWQYDYETEKAILLNKIQGVLKAEGGSEGEREEGGGEGGMIDGQTQVHSSDMEQSPSGGSMESASASEDNRRGSGEQRGRERRGSRHQGGGRERSGSGDQRGEEGAEDSRKVRFSAHLPPTRQSRFGPEDEEEEEEEHQRMASPDNQQLLRGSAASHGFRRRQVHRLMSLQTDPRGQRSPGTAESNHRNEGRRLSEPILAVSHIQLSPANELVFTGSQETELLCSLSLSNTSQDAAAFKIKTTAPRRYKVRPNLALIQPQSVTKVQVLLVPGSPCGAISEDKFLVQIFSFSASVPVPSQNQLLAFWRALPEKDIVEHRMRCRWVKESANSLLPQSPAPTPTPHNLPLPSSPPTSPSHTDPEALRELRIIANKLDRLVKANHQIGSSLHRLQRWTFILLVLLAVLLLRTLFL